MRNEQFSLPPPGKILLRSYDSMGCCWTVVFKLIRTVIGTAMKNSQMLLWPKVNSSYRTIHPDKDGPTCIEAFVEFHEGLDVLTVFIE